MKCRGRLHAGPLVFRRRDARRAQHQCDACGKATGHPTQLAQLTYTEQTALGFWHRPRPSRKNSRPREYVRFLHSAVWLAQRERVLIRDGYRCQGENCGEPATCVHHVRYRKVLADVPDSDLRASCRRCNAHERQARIGRDRTLDET